MAPLISDGVTIVIKSTVPVGTSAEVASMISQLRPDLDFAVASDPEFLREGSAIEDFVNVDRIAACRTADPAEFERSYRGLVPGRPFLRFKLNGVRAP
jgi:UDPglucose 6-dehydrogenase